MNVLSLFDGMGGSWIALRELGIKVDKGYSSEVDKHAISQVKLNFPDVVHLGSVTDVDVSQLGRIDLLMGGSPCQSFSFAGKRNGMSTTENEEIYTLDRYLQLKFEGFQFEGQSYLFWEYIRILTDIRKYNPDVMFLLENVEMSKKWERVLSEAIGVYGVHINSALVSAQNRKRIYWTNIRTKNVGLFNEICSDIPQPKDKGIFIRDILESDVDEKYYITSPKCLDYIQDKGRLDKKYTQINGDKSITMMAGQYVNWSGNYICVAMRGRNPDNPSDRTPGIQTEQRIEVKRDEKTNCLTTVKKDNLVLSGTISPFDEKHFRIRSLTPIECARLQTVPDWYKWGCPEAQIYKMLGNGWTIAVIVHILSFMTKKNIQL